MLRCTGAVKDTGEVIRFTGQYKASRGQAAALVFYVFMGEPSRPTLPCCVASGSACWTTAVCNAVLIAFTTVTGSLSQAGRCLLSLLLPTRLV